MQTSEHDLDTERGAVVSESFSARLQARLDSGRFVWRWRGATLVVAMLALRYGEVFFGGYSLIDESTYLQAFEARRAGLSPYTVVGYLYTPVFAEVGAWMVSGFGSNTTRWLLRLCNIGGLLVIASSSVTWFVTAKERAGFWPWLLLATLLVVSTGVRFGLLAANLSFMASGLLLAALHLVERRPWLAGALLAASALVKPFAVPAVAVLAVAGFRDARRSWLTASGIATLLVCASSLPLAPYWAEMVAAQPSALTKIRAMSVGRMLRLVGLPSSDLFLTITLIGCLCGVAWVCARHRIVVLVTCMFGVLVMPVVWNHSLVVLTPLFCGALALALQRRSSLKELALVTVAGLAFLVAETGAVDVLPVVPQLLLLLPPLVAPILLAIYVTQLGAESLSRTNGTHTSV